MSPEPREIHACSYQLQKEHARRGKRKSDWLTYALLQLDSWNSHTIQEELYQITISDSMDIAEVKCIIDAKEAYVYKISDNDERLAFFNACAEEYERALTYTWPVELVSELMHHRGKALRRCGNLPEAIACFNNVLELQPLWHATLGQIAHAGKQYGADETIKKAGEDAARKLLDYIFDDYLQVPLRVSLANMANMRSYSNLVRDVGSDACKVKKLAEVISISSLEGLDQFYEAYFCFTSMFSFLHGPVVVSLAKGLPEMFEVPPDSIEQRQRISACEAFTNTASAAECGGDSDLKCRSSEAAYRLANLLSKASVLRSFDARALAKTYIMTGHPEKALQCVGKADRIDHWLLYQKSKAQLMARDLSGALESALKAFELAQSDNKAADKLSSYHELIGSCYKESGKIELAIKEYDKAIQKCTEVKYREELSEQRALL